VLGTELQRQGDSLDAHSVRHAAEQEKGGVFFFFFFSPLIAWRCDGPGTGRTRGAVVEFRRATSHSVSVQLMMLYTTRLGQ